MSTAFCLTFVSIIRAEANRGPLVSKVRSAVKTEP